MLYNTSQLMGILVETHSMPCCIKVQHTQLCTVHTTWHSFVYLQYYPLQSLFMRICLLFIKKTFPVKHYVVLCWQLSYISCLPCLLIASSDVWSDWPVPSSFVKMNSNDVHTMMKSFEWCMTVIIVIFPVSLEVFPKENVQEGSGGQYIVYHFLEDKRLWVDIWWSG